MRKVVGAVLGTAVTACLALLLIAASNNKSLAAAVQFRGGDSFSDYRVAIVTDIAISPGLQSAIDISAAITLESTSELVEQDRLAGFDAVLFGGNTLETVDPAWLRDRYWGGLIVVDLNGIQGRLSRLLQSEACAMSAPHPALGDNFFVLRSHAIFAEFAHERDLITQSAFNECGADDDLEVDILGYVVESESGTQMSLASDDGYSVLLQSLRRSLRGVSNSRQAFVTRALQRPVTFEDFVAALRPSGYSDEEIAALWEGA